MNLSIWREGKGRSRSFVLCAALAVVHLGALAWIRVSETREALSQLGIEAPFPGSVAFSSLVAYKKQASLRGALACAEAVRAAAPGSALSVAATIEEYTVLVGRGRVEEGLRVAVDELEAANWANHSLVRHLTLAVLVDFRMSDLGGVKEELAFVDRATGALSAREWPLLHEWAVVVHAQARECTEAIARYGPLRQSLRAPPRPQTLFEVGECLFETGAVAEGTLMKAEASALRKGQGGEDFVPRRSNTRRSTNNAPDPTTTAAVGWAWVLGADVSLYGRWMLLPLVFAWLVVGGRPRGTGPWRPLVGCLFLLGVPVAVALAEHVTQGALAPAIRAMYVVEPSSDPRALLWLSGLICGDLLLAAFVGVPLATGRNLASLGWTLDSMRTREVLLGLAVGLGYGALVFGGRVVSGGGAPRWEADAALAAIALGAFAALHEETLYRGGLMGCLGDWRVLPPWAAVVLQALIFTAGHVLSRGAFGPALLAGIGWFVLAVLLGWLVRRAGGLLPAVGAHWIATALSLYPGLVADPAFRKLLRLGWS